LEQSIVLIHERSFQLKRNQAKNKWRDGFKPFEGQTAEKGTQPFFQMLHLNNTIQVPVSRRKQWYP